MLPSFTQVPPQPVEPPAIPFRRLLAEGPYAVTVLDRDGSVRYDGPSVGCVAGYAPAQWQGRPVLLRAHPNDRPQLRQAFQTLLATPGARFTTRLRVRHDAEGWRQGEVELVNRLDDPEVGGVIAYTRLCTPSPPVSPDDTERWVQRLLYHTSDLVVLVRPDRSYAYVSPSVRDMLGYDPDAYASNSPFESIHPEDVGRVQDALRRAVQRPGEAQRVTYRRRHKDGPWVWLESLGRVVEAPGGQQMILTVARDVTERMELEHRLREREAYVQALVQSAPVLLFATDEDGTLTFIEGDMLNRFPKGTIARLGSSVFETAGSPEIDEKLRSALSGTAQSWHLDYHGLYLETRVSPLRDASGRIRGLTGVCIDLSERQQLMREREVRSVHQRALLALSEAAWDYEGDLEALLDRVVRTVADVLNVDLCKVLEHRAAFDDMLLVAGVGWDDGLVGVARVGPETSSPAGYTLSVAEPVIVADVRTEGRFQTSPLLEEHGAVSGVSTVIYGIDGPYGVLGVHHRSRRTFTSDEVYFIRGVANLLGEVVERHRYTTDLERQVQRRTEQLEDAVQQLESFAYSVSHDLRSPLRAMEGFSRVVLERYEQQLDAKGRQYLKRIQANAVRMGTLIDDLLGFSRVGRRQLQTRSVNIEALVRGVIDDLGPAVQGREIDFAIGPLPPCQADPALLRQVFANLIGNAVKFTARCHEARIEVDALTDGEVVRYRVADNGAGFDMRHADKLFGVFQRLHRQTDYEGTGVGLAIVDRVIQRHGGTIWAEAELGRGATFFFTLRTCG